MLSRSSILRHTIARQAKLQSTRSYAAASGSFAYKTGDANGIKFASRDQAGPVTTVALVAKAGTRYEFLPGLAEALDRYSFKNTERRSALRIQRESELLGAELYNYHTRENLVVGAKFLRDDLPYFLELLAEVATLTKYEPHVLHEEVFPHMELNMKKHLGNPLSLAVDSAHGLAFHRGLGVPLNPTSSTPFKKYLDVNVLSEYAASALRNANLGVVANGVEDGALNKWVGEFFTDVPAQAASEIKSEQAKYYGGEERIAHAGGNAMVLGFTGSSSSTGSFYKPELAVLASLLGGESSIKWSPGFSLLAKAAQETPLMHISTKSDIYTDAGLLTISLKGSAQDLRASAPRVVEALKSAAQGISEEEFHKAKALAKFKELEYGSSTAGGIALTGAGLVRDGKAYQIEEVASAIDGVTVEKVKQAAKEALEHKASVSTVGDLYALPYAEEIGLKV